MVPPQCSVNLALATSLDWRRGGDPFALEGASRERRDTAELEVCAIRTGSSNGTIGANDETTFASPTAARQHEMLQMLMSETTLASPTSERHHEMLQAMMTDSFSGGGTERHHDMLQLLTKDSSPALPVQTAHPAPYAQDADVGTPYGQYSMQPPAMAGIRHSTPNFIQPPVDAEAGVGGYAPIVAFPLTKWPVGTCAPEPPQHHYARELPTQAYEPPAAYARTGAPTFQAGRQQRPNHAGSASLSAWPPNDPLHNSNAGWNGSAPPGYFAPREQGPKPVARAPVGATAPREWESRASPQASVKAHDAADQRTTVTFRNLPPEVSRKVLLEELDDAGFSRLYDFVYMPVDFQTSAPFGYCFINMVSPHEAEQLMAAFVGFDRWKVYCEARQPCEPAFSHIHQGLAVHIDRYRNSPVMHASVPEEYKPMMFSRGRPVPFPPPTRSIKAPRVRRR